MSDIGKILLYAALTIAIVLGGGAMYLTLFKSPQHVQKPAKTVTYVAETPKTVEQPNEIEQQIVPYDPAVVNEFRTENNPNKYYGDPYAQYIQPANQAEVPQTEQNSDLYEWFEDDYERDGDVAIRRVYRSDQEFTGNTGYISYTIRSFSTAAMIYYAEVDPFIEGVTPNTEYGLLYMEYTATNNSDESTYFYIEQAALINSNGKRIEPTYVHDDYRGSNYLPHETKEASLYFYVPVSEIDTLKNSDLYITREIHDQEYGQPLHFHISSYGKSDL